MTDGMDKWDDHFEFGVNSHMSYRDTEWQKKTIFREQ